MKLVRNIALVALLAGTAAVQAQDPATPAASAALPNIATENGAIKVERLASFNAPWGMEWLPDGRLLVTERPGRLRIFADGRVSDPIPGVPEVHVDMQGGLADVTVDPEFERNGYIYLSFAERAEKQPADAKETQEPRFGGFLNLNDVTVRGTAVARARLTEAGLEDLKVIWRQEPKMVGRGHYSGRLAFGPDGNLYITSGDRMRFDPAQDRASSIGKIIRIDRDGNAPSDNPFAKEQGARPEIWTLGHRSILGLAFEPGTSRLWSHEMGPKGGDELNLIVPGSNYGWPEVSEGVNYNDAPIPNHSERPEFTAPVRSWNPVISPSGLMFYTGDLLSWPCWPCFWATRSMQPRWRHRQAMW
jgi:glucose/arabinose dehydrogenase